MTDRKQDLIREAADLLAVERDELAAADMSTDDRYVEIVDWTARAAALIAQERET